MRTQSALARTLTAVAALALGAPLAADAATVTTQPSAPEARTFATSQGGWSSSVQYGGVCIIPGTTCPLGTPSFQAAGGAGGAGDGHLRANVATLLGLLSDVTIAWASPTFTAPAETDQATLTVAVRPQIASLLGIGAAVRLDAVLADVDAPGDSTTIARTSLTAASSSFAPLQLAVPPGAVVAGRRYRIELRTVVNAPAAIATSGSLDLDDVALQLADLVPPSGLTASVPGTGAPRIVGAVSPQGQATSVTAQYGPTAAYGSSTTPVGVSGAGSQAYTIPLAGLTAGATYHYRVVATNADGAIATNDATFVAPTPPSDAPPLVTGPGNSRARAVVYDRGPDVAAASVEVLDGLGAVRSTDADLDGDGHVTVTLPDADGDYGVRVLRTNATAQTTASASVLATLDRVAPSTAGVALAVLPLVSADHQRSVSFTPPPDAVAAVAQVLDAGGDAVGPPVSAAGGMATVQLGAVDGDYAVRLTLADAAGNAASVLSGSVTLDGTAPGAGGAPLVTGAGNARRRGVSFDRDPATVAATIEVLDGDGDVVDSVGVLLGDDGEVTLPDADGAYMVRVRQSDLLANESTSAAAPVVLDRVAPDAGPAPTVAGTSGGRQREVSFVRALDAASAAIEVRDDRAAVVLRAGVPSGNAAEIELPDLDGAYGVRVVQTDWAGNAAASPDAGAALDRSPRTPQTPTEPTTPGPPAPTPPAGGSAPGGGSGAAPGGSSGGRAGGLALTDPARFGALLAQCYGAGELVVTDARRSGSRVLVVGLTRYAAGTEIAIVDEQGRTVGHATANARGRFLALVSPPVRGRAARTLYRAVVGASRSDRLRLRRSNALGAVSVRGGVATIRGRVDLRALGRRVRIVAFGSRGTTACRSASALRRVGRVRLNRRTGAYVLRVRVPNGSGTLALRTRASGKRVSNSAFALR